MNRDSEKRPDDSQELKALVLELQQKIDQQSQFIDQLLEQIRLARHQHFGVRSERYSLDQLALVFNEAEVAAEQMPEDDSTDDTDASSAAGSIVVPAHLRRKASPCRTNWGWIH